MMLENESLFVHAFNNAPIGMALVTPNGYCIKVNACLCSMLGYSEEELLALHVGTLTHPDDLDPDLNLSEQALAGKINHYQIEKRYFHKMGRPVSVLMSASLVRDDQGQPLYFIAQIEDVTERRRTENLLKANQQRYKSLFEHHADLVLTMTLDGRILSANDACEKVTGITKDEMIGLTPDTLMQNPELFNQYLMSAADGEPKEFEECIVHKSGDVLLLRITFVPVIVDDCIEGVYCIAKDITEFRATQRILNENQEKYKSLFQYNPDAVAQVDLHRNFVSVNPMFSTLTGYSTEELLSMTFVDLAIPQDVTLCVAQFNKTLAGQPLSFEARMHHKCGRMIHINITNVPIIVDNEIVGIYAIVQDITELRYTSKQLRQSEELYQLLAENAQDIITYLSPDAIFQYVSPGVRALLGYEPDDLIGQLTFSIWHPDDVTALSKTTVLRSSDIGIFTCRIQHKNGHYVWMETTVKAIRNDFGMVEKILGIGRDITERKKVEEERKHAQLMMLNSEKLSVAGQLAAGIAHEIRNPLTAIKGFVKLLQRQLQEKPHYFEIIDSEIDRIELILNELLILAKPQAIEYHEKNLLSILEQVTTLLESQALLRNVEIQKQFDMHELIIQCDENQLKQVFINFIKNAIEAMPDGGALCIRVSLEGRSQDEVAICIIDQGCGIPEEQLAKLGEPFFSTKEKGTGLGFMVSKKIIESHDGTLLVKSRVNEGTEIKIILPKSRVTELPATQQKHA
ncbi:PAS domain S-box protein [Paenibacillus xerothermodurans]|uniref:histidine kinase n=1 Tax=Paenibacillus xerothermodurans TaxID=1977292 RepID=A0A2W1NIX3_PAEXE|nr:PAS domain S-box protein [Paenibacillus xerothermodurans]PZE19003.1 PAS domain S-box protein [Paenibacillus xerothermodurans]